jgi:hypothetical protein
VDPETHGWVVMPFDCVPEPFQLGDWRISPHVTVAPSGRELDRVGNAIVVELDPARTEIRTIVIESLAEVADPARSD